MMDPPDAPNTTSPPDAPNTMSPPDAPNTMSRPDAPNTMSPPDAPNTMSRPDAPNTMGPPDTPKSPRQAHRKLSEILMSTVPVLSLGITGPVPAATFRSAERLADAFGFGSADAFKSWFDSPAFQIFYSELQKHLEKIADQSQSHHQGHGPTFATVEKAIYHGERNGLMKYSSIYNLDIDNFSELDFYALCLVRMAQYNQNSRDGAFFGRKMSTSDIQCRLWQAILRANYNLAPSRQTRSQRTNLSTDLQMSSLTSSSQAQGSSEGSSQVPFGSNNGGASSQAQGSGEGNSQVPFGSSNSSASSQVYPREGNSQVQFGSNNTSNRDSRNREEALTEWEKLKQTVNLSNPFDVLTRFGKYLCIQVALEGYKDPMKIQTRYIQQQLSAGVELDLQALNEESRKWYEELQLATEKNKFNMKEASNDELNEVSKMEELMDNPQFQRLNYLEDCKSLCITDTKFPRLESMIRTMKLESWQVTGIKALIDFEADKDICGCIEADSTGLGKTVTCICFWTDRIRRRQQEMSRYIQDQEIQAAWEGSGQAGPHPNAVPKPPAKPILLIVPAEVIPQWEDDVSRFNPSIKCAIYYGPKSYGKNGVDTHVGDILTRKSQYFNGHEKNATTVIITSPETFRMRHGPGALRTHRISQLGWSPEAADAAINLPDKEWERDLSGLFDLVTIDEAHVIKSPNTGINTAIQWLQSPFTVMVTATVLPNDITDCEGYIQLIEGGRDLWTPANLQKWAVSYDVNPFELPDNHPAAILRLTLRAVRAWITNPNSDPLKRGFYLQKIWKKCLIRRTYVSKDPARPESKSIIGESLPKLFTRNIICRFNQDEQKEYDALATRPLRKLAHFLPDGRVCWNRKYARQLMLLSTATWFHWVNALMTADRIKEWMATDYCLWSIVKAIHTFKIEATGNAGFELPEKEETSKLLALLCQGSPKLRQVLQVIGSLVILSQQKLTIWCGLPANQVLIWACLQALDIDSAIYAAHLSSPERQELVRKFTQDPNKCVVWVGSFAVGSVGLNLQSMCHHSLNFDSPINSGQAKQAIGRIRRLKQPFTVEQFEVSVENSFQSRIIQNALKKAVPGATVDLSMDVQENETTDSDKNLTKAFSVGCWFRVGDQLIEAPDPRVDGLPKEQQLSPEELVSAILDIHRGKREESQLNHTWVEESVDAEMIDIFYDTQG